MMRLLLTLLVFSWAGLALSAPPALPMNPMVPGQATVRAKAPSGTPRVVPRTQAKPAPQSAAERAAIAEARRLNLKSASLLVLDEPRARVLMAREPDKVMPIASITKLMTAMVVLDARLRMDEVLTIGNEDVDRVKMSGSRLRVGTRLTRREMLHLALMSSENRAASALSRHYPGGRTAFVRAMNAKARALGMTRSRFVDSTGLSKLNVSTATELARMVAAAHRYQSIRQFTTVDRHVIKVNTGGKLTYLNSNRLVQTRSRDWQIDVSKTGYTSEAGRCLVMHARIKSRPVIVVLLNSWGKLTPIGDANRIRRWVELHG
jgi:D-alanyl-D-alanine endopeptidase (penicillin-binding protein 7)